jgi:hypothetical protein
MVLGKRAWGDLAGFMHALHPEHSQRMFNDT